MLASKMKSKATRRGLSLIEVMASLVVTTLIGAAAIPAITSEIRRAKTQEARANIEAIARAVTTYYQLHGTLPASPSQTVPADIASVSNQVYQVASADLVDTWSDIGWAPDGPVRYMYKIATTDPDSAVLAAGDKVVISAEGDLDGDGHASKFEITLGAVADGATGFTFTRQYYNTAKPPVPVALAAGSSGSGASPIGITNELE